MNKPNILFITSDQQHWRLLGCQNPEVKTPNLDRLAEQGTLFERAYCPNPTCTPTRSSLLTGKYPSQHGAYSLGTKLPEFEPRVTDIFRENDYRTALIGKAHFQPLLSTDDHPSLEAYPILQDLDFWRNYKDVFYGFDQIELARNHADEAHAGQHYAIWMEQKGLTNWRDYFQPPTGTKADHKHTWTIREEYHYNTWIAERSCAMLDQYKQNDENFFLWASFFDPHPPYLVPEPWDTMYDPADVTVPALLAGEHDQNPPHFQLTQEANPDYSAWKEPDGNAMHGFHSHLHDRDELAKDIAIYYGMTSCMDKYIGQIIDHLDALGLAENTIIVFTSDHGHYFGQHGLIAKGSFHYEDGIRVPMIVRWTGHVPAGKRTHALQSLVDYPQTFLSLCGINTPDDMTGKNQKNVWIGESESAREYVITENRHQPTTIHMKTYIDARFKLTAYYNRDYGEVFDLQADPDEHHNLWASHPDLQADLFEKLLRAEIDKEEPLTPDKLTLSNKSADMYVKSFENGTYHITFNPAHDRYQLFDLHTDPDMTTNLWDEPAHQDSRRQMIRELLFARWGNEPLWMPRIMHA